MGITRMARLNARSICLPRLGKLVKQTTYDQSSKSAGIEVDALVGDRSSSGQANGDNSAPFNTRRASSHWEELAESSVGCGGTGKTVPLVVGVAFFPCGSSVSTASTISDTTTASEQITVT